MRRAQRLRRPYHFRRVRESGTRWSNRLLSLAVTPNHSESSRAGFIVGKHLGGAVRRNRLKRRTREVVRLLYEQIAPGWDLVFAVRPALASASPPELRGAVMQLLKQAGLWREPAPEPQARRQNPQS